MLRDLGFLQHPLESCLYTLFEPTGESSGWIVLEMDDVLGGGNGPLFNEAVKELQNRFKWGKWKYPQDEPVDFSGREVRQFADFSFETSMSRYTAERCKRIDLTRGRASQKKAAIDEDERTALRDLLGSLLWIAREGRPDCCVECEFLPLLLKSCVWP